MNIPVTSADILQQFARTLMTSLDTNKDKQLSTTEFTSFLTSLGVSGDGASPAVPSALTGPAPYLAGFSDSKLANLNHTTVKYLFGRVAQGYSLSSVNDGASAQTLLEQMRPALEAAGITVQGIKNDKLQVLDDAGDSAWVDVIRGANSGDPAFQWHDTRF